MSAEPACLSAYTKDEKVKVRCASGPNLAQLEAATKEPDASCPTRNDWIHESLEDEARRVWEKENE